MRADPVGEDWVHDRLGGWTDRDRDVEFGLPRSRHPRNLGGEVLDVVLLSLEPGGGHEEGKVAVLHPFLLDLFIEEVLDLLPHGVRPRPEDVAAGDVVVFDEFPRDDDLGVPRSEVLLDGGVQAEARFLLGLGVLVLLLLGGRLAAFALLLGSRALGLVDGALELVGGFLEVLEDGHLGADGLVGGGGVARLLGSLERGDLGALGGRRSLRGGDLLGGSRGFSVDHLGCLAGSARTAGGDLHLGHLVGRLVSHVVSCVHRVVGKTAKVELECALDGVRASTGDARGVAPKARR